MVRSEIDLRAADGFGMAASRMEDRLLCAFGLSHAAPIQHESCQTLPKGGVMLLLPFLLECGLLSYSNHYQPRKGFYNFNALFIILAFCFLCRIKSIEQIKQYSPGEFGKLVGYDRIPEVKTVRSMLHEITGQKHAGHWAAYLAKSWIEDENPEVYYIDGHVQVYHGYLANLGKKHVSRQRLCLPGIMEFWVNASDGSPYFFVTSQVNEKMIEMMKSTIVPQLIRLHPVSEEKKKSMAECKEEPLFTLVFDREAYSPDLFAWLWNTYRIAVITYRKNVKDKWDESLFKEYTVTTSMGDEKMQLHEQKVEEAKCPTREVRKQCADGHQTTIVTTNQMITIEQVASNMFARWGQENFFRYMRQDYNIDKIIQYSVDEIDKDIKVVNREYCNITYRIKKMKEKLGRRKAVLYAYEQHDPLQEEDEKKNKKWMKEKLQLIEETDQINHQIDDLLTKRKGIPYKISIGEMPESVRYNRLNEESKKLQNILKMLCYRAETAFASLLSPYYKRSNQEIRTLIKSVIQTPIDMEVDKEREMLIITLYPLANLRSYEAVRKICDMVNATNSIYPDTNLRLVYKIKKAI